MKESNNGRQKSGVRLYSPTPRASVPCVGAIIGDCGTQDIYLKAPVIIFVHWRNYASTTLQGSQYSGGDRTCDFEYNTTTMELATNSFKYEHLPLDGSQVRLVTILPGGELEALRCTVRNFIQTNDLQYEALSYVWGDPTITSPILLNEHEFEVTTNLEAALRNLRYEDKERLLWIDAICINQRSIPEKNAEVRRMHLIYQRAQQVIVWLGRETEPGDIIGAGDSLITAASTLTVQLLDMLSDTQEEMDVLNVLHQTGDVVLALQVLGKLFTRPWFLRIWIVQEIALAKTAIVAFGPQRITWDRFIRAVNAIQSLEYGDNHHIWGISGAARAARVQWCRLDVAREQVKSAAMQLVLLLWQLRTSQVTDSRDRLFGILGLIRQDTSDPLLAIEYQKSAAEVFKDLSTYLIQQGFLADTLCAVTYGIEDLPHWAPIWTAQLEPSKETGKSSSRISKGLGVFLAASRSRGSEGAQARFSEGGRQLTVKGALIDGVAFVSKSYECSKDADLSLEERLESMRARLLLWEDELEECGISHRLYSQRELRLETWKEAILHETEDSWLGQNYDVLLGRAVPTEDGDRRSIPPAKDSAIITRLVTELEMTLGSEFEYRRPFITANGLMGSTGSNCRVMVGDLLCVFVGCAMPFLLRPVEGTQGLFRFMTCCFVPGLMDYDLFSEAAKSAFDVVDICMV